MASALTLWLFIAGIVLFVAGDLIWMVQRTRNRPMNLRVTGLLVLIGVTLIGIALMRLAIGAGD